MRRNASAGFGLHVERVPVAYQCTTTTTTPHSLNITAITILPEVEEDEEELEEG
jgi:hypothetical protein